MEVLFRNLKKHRVDFEELPSRRPPAFKLFQMIMCSAEIKEVYILKLEMRYLANWQRLWLGLCYSIFKANIKKESRHLWVALFVSFAGMQLLPHFFDSFGGVCFVYIVIELYIECLSSVGIHSLQCICNPFVDVPVIVDDVLICVPTEVAL